MSKIGSMLQNWKSSAANRAEEKKAKMEANEAARLS